jgi:hypothetical protein
MSMEHNQMALFGMICHCNKNFRSSRHNRKCFLILGDKIGTRLTWKQPTFLLLITGQRQWTMKDGFIKVLFWGKFQIWNTNPRRKKEIHVFYMGMIEVAIEGDIDWCIPNYSTRWEWLINFLPQPSDFSITQVIEWHYNAGLSLCLCISIEATFWSVLAKLSSAMKKEKLKR